MKSNLTFHTYLSDIQYASLNTVFKDLSSSVRGDWILTGSTSYGFYTRMDYPSYLRDIDVVLVAADGVNPRSIVSKTIKKKFYVIFIQEAVLGYYFGLRHKESSLWVDLFTPVHLPEFEEFDFGSQKIKVQTLEESYYTIIKGLLYRKNDKLMVSEKWLKSAGLLKDRVSLQKVNELLEKNLDEYKYLLPKDFIITSKAIQDYAIKTVTESSYEATSSEYPQNSTITENGISIEQKEEWLKAV